MYCSSCGKEISDDAQFCPFCGSIQQTSTLKQNEADQVVKHKDHRIADWLFLIAAIIVLVIVIKGSPFEFSVWKEGIDAIIAKNQNTSIGETFEIAGVSYTFTDTYTDKEVTFSNGGCIFGSYEVTDSDAIITGCNGLIENRTETYLDLTTLDVVFRCKNDNGNDQTIRGKCRFYVKPSDAAFSFGEEIYTLAPGERAYIYVYTIPEADYHATQLAISVKGAYTGKGTEHKAIIDLE